MAQYRTDLDGTGRVTLLDANKCRTSGLIQSRSESTGKVYVGIGLSSVTAQNGFELCPGQNLPLNADDSPEAIFAVCEDGKTAALIVYENTETGSASADGGNTGGAVDD